MTFLEKLKKKLGQLLAVNPPKPLPTRQKSNELATSILDLMRAANQESSNQRLLDKDSKADAAEKKRKKL